MSRLWPTILVLTCLATRSLWAADPSVQFEDRARAIFARRCGKCHGAKTQKAQLDLSSVAGVMRGGESGAVVTAGKPDDSLLVDLIDAGDMPPEGEPPLTADELDAIRHWIRDGAASRSAAHGERQLTFEQIVPLMLRRCVMCHGPEYRLGGLDLRTYAAAVKGGENRPGIVPGKASESPVVQRVTDKLCPPKADIGEAGIEPMTPAELATLVQWIDGGAAPGELVEDVAGRGPDPLVSDEDRQFWSFVPPQPSHPPTDSSRRAQTEIDLFLLQRLRDRGLEFSAPADRAALARRAAFSLTGLPPDEATLKVFLDDRRPGAFERLVDRLLASPQYGEKWGRFWLDLAGYSDSEGKRNADMIRPYAWKYRDWVIRALADDKPYDRFLVEQLAGDELVDWAAGELKQEMIDKLIATGFLRMAPDGTSADPVNRFSDRLEVISDTIDVLGRGVMGLTMNCARCHSHKYDPIPQRDYYRLTAIFKGAYDEYDWLTPQPFGNQWNKAKQRHLPVLDRQQREALEAHNGPLEEQIKQLRAKRNGLDDPKQKKQLDKQINALAAKRKTPTKIRTLWDRGRPSPTFVYRRGDENQPATLVGPGVPSVLTDGRTPFEPVALEHASPKSGRRLALARWLTAPDHPLTSRVVVNRIWHQHFGHGLVESLDNFGRLGTPCSHPELLDWLAVDFVQHGWSIKRLHRLILGSAAWQQQSLVRLEHERLDPDNRLLSRMPMRRLAAEEVRDTLLRLAGRLDARAFGEPDPVEIHKDGLVTAKPVGGGWRRSVYVRQRRKEMPTLFETFDLPQMNPNCSQRKTSTVVTQPLYLLNNEMIYGWAGDFAARVVERTGADRQRQIREAFQLALGRLPTEQELEACAQAIEVSRQDSEPPASERKRDVLAMTVVCHALFNSASLLYVD